MRPRDKQRSRVYAWERAFVGGSFYQGSLALREVQALVSRVWAAERARYGLAGVPAPAIHDGRGCRWARGGLSKLVLPRWARSPWVALHELAHALTPKDEAHGPRFVAVLVGIAARHTGVDADQALQMAADMGVRVDYRSIGAVPVIKLHDRLIRELPATDTDLALAFEVSVREVQVAALTLIRKRLAKWRGRRWNGRLLVACNESAACG